MVLCRVRGCVHRQWKQLVRVFLPFNLLGPTRVAVSSIDTVAEFAPVNFAQALQSINNVLQNINNNLQNINNNLQNVNNRLHVFSAMASNNRVLMRNVHRRAPQPYFPLQKTVSMCRILQSNLLIISLWN
jgi:hypothetical protein